MPIKPCEVWTGLAPRLRREVAGDRGPIGAAGLTSGRGRDHPGNSAERTVPRPKPSSPPATSCSDGARTRRDAARRLAVLIRLPP